MGRGVKRVAEAEKGREKKRVEKTRPAMATWREEGKRQENKRVRERGEAKQLLLYWARPTWMFSGNCGEEHTWLLSGTVGMEFRHSTNMNYMSLSPK